MSRELIAQMIHWHLIIGFVGFVNVVAMLPQLYKLYKLLKTRETKGLSVGMFWIYLSVQIAFGLQGFFVRDNTLMWSLGLSAVVSATMIIFYYRFRRGSKGHG